MPLPALGAPPFTLLLIPETGIATYSARGVTQSLEPIEASAVLERTVNGRLVNLSPPQFQLYRSVISCEDVDPPSSDGFFPGAVVTVYCACELGVPFGGFPTRPVVPQSQRTDPATGILFYRPVLTMVISKPISVELSEWTADVRWQMELEELGP
jgi:hypothetical protein